MPPQANLAHASGLDSLIDLRVLDFDKYGGRNDRGRSIESWAIDGRTKRPRTLDSFDLSWGLRLIFARAQWVCDAQAKLRDPSWVGFGSQLFVRAGPALRLVL